jgi:hypothetical protein
MTRLSLDKLPPRNYTLEERQKNFKTEIVQKLTRDLRIFEENSQEGNYDFRGSNVTSKNSPYYIGTGAEREIIFAAVERDFYGESELMEKLEEHEKLLGTTLKDILQGYLNGTISDDESVRSYLLKRIALEIEYLGTTEEVLNFYCVIMRRTLDEISDEDDSDFSKNFDEWVGRTDLEEIKVNAPKVKSYIESKLGGMKSGGSSFSPKRAENEEESQKFSQEEPQEEPQEPSPVFGGSGGDDDGSDDDESDDDDDKKRRKENFPSSKKMSDEPRKTDEGGVAGNLRNAVSTAIMRADPAELGKGTEYLIDLQNLVLIKSGSFNQIRLYVDYEKVKKDEFADVFHHFLRVASKRPEGYNFVCYGNPVWASKYNSSFSRGEIEILKRLLNITEKKIDSVEKLIKDLETDLTREINRGGAANASNIAKLSKTLRKIQKEKASLDKIIKKTTNEAESPFKDVATDCGVYAMPINVTDIKNILEKNTLYSVQTMDLITTSMNETFSKIVNKAISYTNGGKLPNMADSEDAAVYNCVIGRIRPRQATKEREIIPEGLIKTKYSFAPSSAAEVLGITDPQEALLAAERNRYSLMNPNPRVFPPAKKDQEPPLVIEPSSSSSGKRPEESLAEEKRMRAAIEEENKLLKAKVEELSKTS